jgi:hypothetical protein
MLNPQKQFVKSEGIDLPILTVYLAGRIAGDCIEKCLAWRKAIIAHYADYKGKGAYPIVFLDALNSKEADSIDAKGLTSAIPPNLIYDKDLLSVQRADVVVAMMDDYMEEGIQEELNMSVSLKGYVRGNNNLKRYSAEEIALAFKVLQEKILTRRPNWGTDSEVAWALYLNKPLILIAGNDRQKKMLEQHPFTKRASVIVSNVEELLERKWLQILYKSIAGATY